MTAADRLKSYVERINRLMDERDALSGDIRDVFQEVKSAGFSPPALRKVIAAMRMDPDKRDEIEAMVEMYRAAVGLARPEAVEMLEAGKTIRETNRATGVALGTLHRRSKTVAKSKMEHTPTQPSAGGSPSRAGNDAAAPSPPAAASPPVETETDRAATSSAPEGPSADRGCHPGRPPRPDPDAGWERLDSAGNHSEAIGAIRAGIVERGEARLKTAAELMAELDRDGHPGLVDRRSRA